MTKKTLIWLITALVAAGLVASSCSGAPEKKEGKLVTEQGPVPRYLELIPADTPYVFAALEPVPLQHAMVYVEKIGGFYDQMLSSLGPMAQSEHGDPQMKRMLAVLELLQGKFSREGLKSLGFTLTPRMALYGVGPLPVFRMDLGDPKAFGEFLERIDAAAQLDVTTQKLGGIEYRVYAVDEVTIPVAVIDQELVLGFAPQPAADLYLPYMLGEKKPEVSYAKENRVESLIQKYGYKPFGAGFVDLERVSEIIMTGGEGLTGEMMIALGWKDPGLSAICQQEYRDLVAVAPRLVFGYQEFSETSVAARGGLELRNQLGERLAAAQRPVPAFDSAAMGDALFRAGLGFHVGEMVDIIRQKAVAIRDKPFQCPHLASYNQLATEASMYLQMAPPVANQVMGVSVGLKAVHFEDPATEDSPESATMNPMQPVESQLRLHGLAFVHTEDPTSLWQSLSMLQPDLASVSLKNDGEPVALPEFTPMVPNLRIAMAGKVLGLSSGEGMVEPMLSGMNDADAGPKNMMALTYNYARIMQVVSDSLPPSPEIQQLSSLFQGDTRIALEPTAEGIFMSFQQDLEASSAKPR